MEETEQLDNVRLKIYGFIAVINLSRIRKFNLNSDKLIMRVQLHVCMCVEQSKFTMRIINNLFIRAHFITTLLAVACDACKFIKHKRTHTTKFNSSKHSNIYVAHSL